MPTAVAVPAPLPPRLGRVHGDGQGVGAGRAYRVRHLPELSFMRAMTAVACGTRTFEPRVHEKARGKNVEFFPPRVLEYMGARFGFTCRACRVFKIYACSKSIFELAVRFMV